MTVSKSDAAMMVIDEIIEHLRSIVFNDKSGRKSVVRSGFEQLAGERQFTRPQMRAVFSHASETGKTEVDGSVAQMWPFFYDGLSKVTMVYGSLKLEQRTVPLLNIIVMSRWNAENFPKILGFAAPENVPSFRASLDQLSDFSVVPAYIERSVMPRLKDALLDHLGIDAPALDKIVAEREQELIRGRVPGYEALMPIKDWPQAKKGSTPKAEGPEVKPL